MHVHTDRSFEFDISTTDMWARIEQVDRYPACWPWLRPFDGRRLAPGERWACTVRPRLPYTVQFVLLIDQVVEEEEVGGRLQGDIGGHATIHLTPSASGCTVRLVADLAPSSPSLRAMSVVAAPLLRLGHDRILDAAADQFVTST